MITCQSEQCKKSFKPKMSYVKETDSHTVTCPHCGTVHDCVFFGYQPSGTLEFKVKKKP